MAFPYIFEANFEQGDNSEWDSEHDGESLLDFPHYSTLAAIPGMGLPYRGSYCMRVQTSDAEEHTVLEGDIDLAASAERWFRFYFWHNLEATSDDILNIFELQSAGAVVEAAVSLQVTAATNLVEVGIGETAASSFGATLLPNQWNCIELKAVLDDGGSNDGTLDMYVNGSAAAVQSVTSLDQAAVIQGVLGSQDALATTTGTMLWDQFVMDDARIYPFSERFDTEVTLTKSSHVMQGPGIIENITLLSGAGTDCRATIYDSDSGPPDDLTDFETELKNTANNETVDTAGVPVDCRRGAYVELAGTNPRAVVKLREAQFWGGEGPLRHLASRRTWQ